MPFGVCNSPATFEQLMEKVLQPVPASACVVYLDNILVHAATYIAALNSLFQQIANANLCLNPAKYSLFHRKTSFLGHVVSEEGVSTDPAKVEVVEQWLVLTSTAEMRSFLGLASYYRRFIVGLADIAHPLHQLTKKAQWFQWSPASQDAFNRLRRALITAPVLAIPGSSKPFILDTDISNDGISAVLSLLGLFPCSLFRRKTSFLGHIVSEEGISTDPAKVEAVEQ
ncbi:hypothetical protein AAFF_G00335220 [Aldrovandia affinis]|uniref:ribonuclease H n=1 Tax=Aldrovandia affinis TaxID=143900 RepID=A0AAD7SL74_9TELE|nr:hypothetical protein AAFF_G00335220 [Aldrovandia affinis]